ncbi:NAD-dependent epimerase/dehydratase family protein [Nocardia sp. NPDC057353]|uniref:NAD-dependent epimerase/dehydratase family protein n=1 Tax=Nocardia sp. NPDC057353 TaxID=3346104 RepID=UPI0036284A2C
MDPLTTAPVLVMGASGFLGSHVARQLVARGDRVRVLLRETSPTRGIDDLDVERHYGDIFDEAAVRAAMSGCEVVYYCVVDTRAWLRDPAPLFRTNVDGLRGVLRIAAETRLRRFVFTSTIGTVGLGDGPAPATEDTPFDWAEAGGAYIRSRREAEELVLRHSREHGLPAVAMCVANTYGTGDWQPTPHGSLVALAALGRMPVYFRGVASEVVDVEDAARALLLAGEHGRPGERYIVSERFVSQREIYRIAAGAGNVPAPRFGIALLVLVAVGRMASIIGRLLRRDIVLNATAVNLLRHTGPLDHGKAVRELGWRPGSAAQAIERAARFAVERRRRRDRVSHP